MSDVVHAAHEDHARGDAQRRQAPLSGSAQLDERDPDRQGEKKGFDERARARLRRGGRSDDEEYQ